MNNNFITKLLKLLTETQKTLTSSKKIQIFGKSSYGILLVSILIVVGTLMFPRDKSIQYSEYLEGTVALEEIISPEHIPIIKTDEEIESEKNLAKESIPPIFNNDPSVHQQVLSTLDRFFDKIEDFNINSNAAENIINQARINNIQMDSTQTEEYSVLREENENKRDQLIQEYNINLDNPNWSVVKNMDAESLYDFESILEQILRDLYAIGMVNVNKERQGFANKIIMVKESNSEILKNINTFFDQAESSMEISNRLQTYYSQQSDSSYVSFELLQNFLLPNVKYDFVETEKLREIAVRNVPLTRGFVQKNERIVDRYERITPEIFRKIESLRVFLSERGIMQGKWTAIIYYIGQSGFFALCIMLFVTYLVQFRKHIINSKKQLSIIFLIILTQLLFTYIIVQKLQLSEYLIPTTIGSMLLAIIFDGGVGFYGTVVVSFMLGGILGNDFGLVLYMVAGGLAGIMSVRKLRNRSQFFRSAIYIYGVYIITFFVVGIMRMMEMTDITMILFQYSLPNALFAPLITLGFMAFFEIFFGVATNMTLLELADLNRPLLRELAIKAPGTYHHSIVLGNLSELAAEKIGANSLLARVGCYYHDIGKMVKPEYFIENHPEAMNKHNLLAPTLSSLIISAHVREGLEIADKYKLPDVIKDFITQHHGTSRISFFYEKAIEKTGDKNLNPFDFSYPGPKPQTKETGIVMLADSVEAATRALKDPSPTRLRERVNSIISGRFQDGQLSHCELTLKDLRIISESFIQILIGMFHIRIEYPEKNKTETESDMIDNPIQDITKTDYDDLEKGAK